MSFELRSFNHFYIEKVQSGAGEDGWRGVEWSGGSVAAAIFCTSSFKQ